jgi:hypothetical protein
MGDQNPMAYVHKGGVRILSYLILSMPLLLLLLPHYGKLCSPAVAMRRQRR